MKTIILTAAAARAFYALPVAVQNQIDDGLDRYAITGQGDIKPLHGRPGTRLRIGRYRVIFDEDGVTILAFYIGKRDSTTYR